MAKLGILVVSLMASASVIPTTVFGAAQPTKSLAIGGLKPVGEEIWRLDRAITRWEQHCEAASGSAATSADVLARDARRLVAAFSGLQGHAATLTPKEREPLRRKLATVRSRLSALGALAPTPDLARCAGSARLPAATPGRPRIVGVAPDCQGATPIGEETVAWQFPAPAKEGVTALTAGEAWLRFDPAHEGRFAAHSRGSLGDTELAIFESCAAKAPVGLNDDLFGLQSGVGFSAEAGASRWIRLRQRAGAASDPVFLTVRGTTGGIAGVVTESSTGNAIPNVRVEISLRADGGYEGSMFTDGTGAYLIEGLDPAAYVARTEYTDEHVDELWDDRPCSPNCDVTTGDPIIVAPGEVTSGIDFALLRAGAVSGRLRDAETAEAVPFFRVVVVEATGSWVGSVESDAAGRYRLGGLDPGLHFVFTDGDTHRNEIYDDIPCTSFCDPLIGTPIQVMAEESVPNIDFALDALGSVSGAVIDAANGRPIPLLRLGIYDALGSWAGWAETDETGRYLGGGLVQGSYFVTTEAFARYRNEVWDDIPCSGQGGGFCDPLSGTAIPVTTGATTPGIDFALDRLGVLSGQVVADTSADPIPFLEVSAWADNGDFVERGTTNALGIYVVEDLHAGTYFATTENDSGYLDELYDDLPCLGSSWPGCNPTVGTPIVVTLGAVTAGIDFALTLGGAVTGTLSDAFTGSPIRSERVYLWDAGGVHAGDDRTDDAGNFYIGSLLSGTYFASSDTSGDFVEELYDDLPCPEGAPGGCDPTTGTPILVTVGTTSAGIDMDLVLRGGLSGVVTAASSGLPVPGVGIDIWDASGNHVATGGTSSSGGYQIDLTSGLYYLSTDTGQGYLEEIYDDVPCPEGPAILGLCDPLDGAPVLVIGADPVMRNLDFALAQPLFVDGFESGDTTAWSLTVP